MTSLVLLASGGAPTASQVVPGVLGFLVVAGMGLVLFFLLRSMNKQLRRVAGGARWEQQAADPAGQQGAAAAGAKQGGGQQGGVGRGKPGTSGA